MQNYITKEITLQKTIEEVWDILIKPEENVVWLSAFHEWTYMEFETVLWWTVEIGGADKKIIMKWLITDITPMKVLEITMYDDSNGTVSDTLSPYKERYEIAQNDDGTITLKIYGGVYYRPGWEEHFAMHDTMRNDALERMKK